MKSYDILLMLFKTSFTNLKDDNDIISTPIPIGTEAET